MGLKDSNDLSAKKFEVLIDMSYAIHSQVSFISSGIDLIRRRLGNDPDEDLLRVLELTRSSAYRILSLKDNCMDFFMLTSEKAPTFLKKTAIWLKCLMKALKHFINKKSSPNLFPEAGTNLAWFWKFMHPCLIYSLINTESKTS